MIVLDSDVFVIDLRYPADSRYLVNRRVLESLQLSTERLAVTCQTLLEVIGIVSFNSPAAWTGSLPAKLPIWYSVEVRPDLATHPDYASCSVAALIAIMAQRCSLGDAIVLEQMRLFVPEASLFLSWNARHFRSKLSIPAQTPEEWWQQNQPTP
jgi:hypothetical protein